MGKRRDESVNFFMKINDHILSAVFFRGVFYVFCVRQNQILSADQKTGCILCGRVLL